MISHSETAAVAFIMHCTTAAIRRVVLLSLLCRCESICLYFLAFIFIHSLAVNNCLQPWQSASMNLKKKICYSYCFPPSPSPFCREVFSIQPVLSTIFLFYDQCCYIASFLVQRWRLSQKLRYFYGKHAVDLQCRLTQSADIETILLCRKK